MAVDRDKYNSVARLCGLPEITQEQANQLPSSSFGIMKEQAQEVFCEPIGGHPDTWSPEMSQAASGAMREKLNYLPYDLIPFQEIVDAYSRVAEFGAKKYAPWNWSMGLSRVQLCGSLLRHVFAYLRGEDSDLETGLNHGDHILWNAVALVHNVHWNLEDGRRVEPERNYKHEGRQG